MAFPQRFSDLPDYAFPRLRALLGPHAAGGPVVDMTIGEPKHAMPGFIAEVMAAHIDGFAKYPPNDGTPELLAGIAGWVGRRYGVTLDPARQIMALNGSREGLYTATLALCPEEKAGRRPVVLIPNPFYQVYAMGALSAGAEPVFLPASAETGFLPDFAALPAEVLDRTVIAFICSPANPQGAVADRAYLAALVALAEKHDFLIFADECYGEIYRDTPPPGALEVAAEMGAHPDRVLGFQSLSKRSNLPGLRSGFVAGGAEALARIKQLRAYAGAPLPLPVQRVSERVWADEAHVTASRALYQEKFRLADRIMADVSGYQGPEGGFFLWLRVPEAIGDGEAAAVRLWRETGVRVLPGGYLGRAVNGVNPGQEYIRVALVGPVQEVQRGITSIRDCLYG